MSSCSASSRMGTSKPRWNNRDFVPDLGATVKCTSSWMSDPIPPDQTDGCAAIIGERFRVQRRLDPSHEYQRRDGWARAADGGSTSTQLQRRQPRSLPEKVRAPSTKREEKSRFGSKTSFSRIRLMLCLTPPSSSPTRSRSNK